MGIKPFGLVENGWKRVALFLTGEAEIKRWINVSEKFEPSILVINSNKPRHSHALLNERSQRTF